MGTKTEMNFDCFNAVYIDTNHQSETFHQKMVSNYLRDAHINLDIIHYTVHSSAQPSLVSPTFFIGNSTQLQL